MTTSRCDKRWPSRDSTVTRETRIIVSHHQMSRPKGRCGSVGMKVQLREMLRQGSGAVVNTSSPAGLIGSPELGAYVASKHGVVGLTKSAAVECAERGVRVNAVCPAAIRTPMMDGLDPEMQQELMAPQAMKRFGETNEVAEAVVWLCSDRSSFVTGVAMPVDAGATAF